ncbi:hypothetical protein HZS_1901 [Henneguya salminicola]|nr:hypothetical protein HZS_1901 [Henneguya salminicola]
MFLQLKYCQLVTCQNDGVTSLILNSKKVSFNSCMCECKSRYFGKLCQHKYRCKNCNINGCARNNSCLNCASGWNGKNCLNRIIDTQKICLNNGTRKINATNFKCDCNPPFYGKYCEINCSDICLSNHCSMEAIIFFKLI